MTPGRGFREQAARFAMPPSTSGASRLLASGYQGAVYLVETDSGPLIVKKPMGRGLIRAARRAMLRREFLIYRRLAGLAGVPPCYGLNEQDELVLGFVEGQSLRDDNLSGPDRERYFSELLELIEAIHRAGVAHGDLKRKDNIIIGRDGRPYVLDFGTAISAPAEHAHIRRALFNLVCRIDVNAWFKLKYHGTGLTPPAADLRRYQPSLPEKLARWIREPWRLLTLRRWRKSRR